MTVSEFLNKDLNFLLSADIHSATKGDKHNYLEINCSLDFSITNTLTAEGKEIVIPYLFCFAIYINEKMIYVYGRSLNDLESLMDYIKFYLDDIMPNLYIPVYMYDINRIYYSLLDHIEIEEPKVIRDRVAHFRSYCFEFRCIRVYSDLNEDKMFHMINFKPDKSIIKTPITELDNADYEYIRLRCTAISEYVELVKIININDDGSTRYSNIPRTMMAFVRNKLKRSVSNNPIVYPKIQSEEEYYILKKGITGGLCDYNREFSNQWLKGVSIFDAAAMHPSRVFSCGDYPIEFVEYIDKLEVKEYINKALDYCIISRIVFKNLKHKKGYPHLPKKCVDFKYGYNLSVDYDFNDLESAKRVTLNMCDLDLIILNCCYTYDKFVSVDNYIYKRGYLPKSIAWVFCENFVGRSEATNPAEEHCKKVGTNGGFGLLYQDPCKTYNGFDGENLISSKRMTPGKVKESLDNYNINLDKKGNYTCYHWGFYTAALSRIRIFKMIKKACELGIWVYSDTDSVDVRNDDIEKYREFVDFVNEVNMETRVENYRLYSEGFERRYLKYKYEKNGKTKELGVFELEHTCALFKVIKKKEYVFVEVNNGKPVVVPKTSGADINKVQSILSNNLSLFDYNKILEGCRPNAKRINTQPDTVIDYQGNVYKNEFSKGIYTFYEDFWLNEEEEIEEESLK